MIKSTVLTLLVAALFVSGPFKVDIVQRNATVKSFSEAFTSQTGILFSYESTLSDADSLYFAQVNLRIEEKLLSVLN